METSTWCVCAVQSHSLENISKSKSNCSFENEFPVGLFDFVAFCYSIFAIVGVTGNVITILALAKSPKHRNSTTAFIINLAIADLIFCSFTCPLNAATFASRCRVYGDGAICKLFAFITYTNCAVSVFTVVAITINRYICIVHSSMYPTVYHPRNVAMMITTIWISSFIVLSFPLFEVWGRFGPLTKVSCDVLPLRGKSPKLAVFVTILLLPTLSFILCYSQIYLTVRKASLTAQASEVPGTPNSTRSTDVHKSSKMRQSLRRFRSWMLLQKAQEVKETKQERKRKKELKILKMALVIFIVYAVCYFPVCLLKMIGVKEIGSLWYVIGYLLAFLANCINPIIYVALSDEYRKAYFRLFGWRKNVSPQTSSVTNDSLRVFNVTLPKQTRVK